MLARNHRRCAVPGCRHATFVDIHHVIWRSQGGDHDPELLTVLCSAHHRALHDGAIRIEGAWSTGFLFFHADGSPYGRWGRSLSPHAGASLEVT